MEIAQSLCGDCGKACKNGCSWAESFTPVEGWTAVRDEKHDSYMVIDCPEFLCDCGVRIKEIDEVGAQNLLIAIAHEAVKDYKHAVKYHAYEMQESIERFFRGKLMASAGIDANYLMRRLRVEVGK